MEECIAQLRARNRKSCNGALHDFLFRVHDRVMKGGEKISGGRVRAFDVIIRYRGYENLCTQQRVRKSMVA